MNASGWFEALGLDLRFGFRTLRRNPGFTAVATLTLALGVGANTAIFSMVKAVLLDPLPYREAGRLVTIAEATPAEPGHPELTYTTVRALRERSRSFDSMSAFGDGPGILFKDGIPRMLRGLSVDWDFFNTLGVPMYLGRDFRPEDQQKGRRLALILSHALWVREFGADPQVLGRVVRLSLYDVKVVGVLPPGFKPLLKATSELDPEMYYPLALDPYATCGDCQGVHLIGRLKRGVKAGAAHDELAAVLAELVRENPAAHAGGAELKLESLPGRLLGGAGTALWAVWCAAGFVLLIACANVANLLLARATGRATEIAARAALGAERARIVRQLVTESMLLAAAGGALGIALAWLGTSALASLAPARLPRAQEAHVDGAVLGFALAATVVAGLLFGLAPAWRASRIDLSRALKGSGGSGRAHAGLRNSLAAAEIGLAFVLTVGAALMLTTFWRLMMRGAGFEPRNVLTLTTCVIGPRGEDPIGYYREVLEKLRALPEVRGAALSSLIPMDYTEHQPIFRADRPRLDGAAAPLADDFSVSTDYFPVMRIPLKAGRLFTEQDSEKTMRVAIVNEACARSQFAGENPVGKHIRMGHSPWMTVVGVVGDVRQDGIDRPADMQVYQALNQEAVINYYRLLVRTAGDPRRAEKAVRTVLAGVDIGSPVFHVKPLQEYVAGRLANRSFALALLGLFGSLALALAGVGVYGVFSYSAALRTREVGIRMALGAGRGKVVRLMLRQALPVAAAGLAVGWGVSLALGRLLTSLLFEVKPGDAAILSGTAALLGAVALAAAFVPARRAASVDPMSALRQE